MSPVHHSNHVVVQILHIDSGEMLGLVAAVAAAPFVVAQTPGLTCSYGVVDLSDLNKVLRFPHFHRLATERPHAQEVSAMRRA
eukprot:SAG11_NODE_18191_length_497_cov_1.952261_1_plen_83_part_00